MTRVQITTRYHGPSERPTGTCKGSHIVARVRSPRSEYHGRRLSVAYDHAARTGEYDYAAIALARKVSGLDITTAEYVATGCDSRGVYTVYSIELETTP